MKTRIINASTELKNEPSAHKRTMSSVEITEMTGKRHSDVMRSIRAMEPAWVKNSRTQICVVLLQRRKQPGTPYVSTRLSGMYVHRHQVQRRSPCKVNPPLG